MRKVKITGRGLPKYQQQPGTIGDFTCAPGERFDETLGQCVPDVNYSAQTTPTTTAAPQYDIYGCEVGVTEWSVADQKCVPIGQKAPQKFNVNSKLSTGTPKTGSGTGVNPQSNFDQSFYRAFPGAALAAIGVNMLSGVADKLQNADLQKRVEEAQKRFGMTDSRFGPMRNVYSYGRTPTGYAYNQMVPVQFAGKPTFEAMTVPQFAQDGIEVVRDIMQLPTLYTGDPTASGLYAEDPAIQEAMTKRYADVNLPTEDITGVLTSPAVGPVAAPIAAPTIATSAKIDANLSLPLDPYAFKFSSGFGSRKAPKAGASTDHNGVDLGIKEGSNIYSIKPGVIYQKWYDDKGGNQVIIKHDDGTRSGYAHLQSFATKEGDRVDAGSIIGYVGNTGVSTGSHLHFTYRDAQGNRVDPMTLFDFKAYSRAGKSPEVGTKFNGQVSYTHNNPLNIHYGKFTSGYGATKGANDSDGNVAIFPDLNTGIKAAKDLLFNPNSAYFNLRISEARNRWVNGNVDQPSESTRHIVKSMGKDVYISQLTPVEKDKLLKLFAKWEGKQGYNAIKDLPLFKEGGVYELDDNEIQQILANGGQIEFL